MDSNFPRPVIGISGASAESASVQAMIRQVEATGGVPLLLANHGKRDASADIKKIDALIVMGSDFDIDPARYGAASYHPKTNSENANPQALARADYEEAMLQAALEARMPVLGVCAGMQRLNVLCGGTLHQHVPDLVGHDEHTQKDYGIGMNTPVQPVLLVKDTALGTIARDLSIVFTPGHAAAPSVILENSMHHQAVAEPGKGLRISAYAEDKVALPSGQSSHLIEAIEADPNGPFGGQFVLGVQWHPEFGASPLGERIAAHAADAAQAYAKETNRQHDAGEAARETALSSAKEIAAPRPGGMVEMILRRRASAHAQAALAR